MYLITKHNHLQPDVLTSPLTTRLCYLKLTQEVVCGEVVGVPHLQREARRDLVLGLVPGEHGLLLGDYDLLLGHEVLKGVDEAPVEVPLARQRVVVHVRVLLVLLLAFQPPRGGGGEHQGGGVQNQGGQAEVTLTSSDTGSSRVVGGSVYCVVCGRSLDLRYLFICS